MERNLKEVLELSIAGVPLVSMAGCGSYASTNETKFLEEICTRWYQLAAYMPAMYSFYEDNQYSRLPSSFSDSTGDLFVLCPKLYFPSTLNIDSILWHPQLIVDAAKW